MPVSEHPHAPPPIRAPAGSWFPAAWAETEAPVQLLCFSYAGGTPSIFQGWQEHLGDAVAVLPVLLPGRGMRLRETPYTAVRPLVGDIATALVKHGLTADYAMFGHSMGALLAYEVSCELRRRGEPGPAHLFVSASKAPHLYGGRADHTLPDRQLRQLVRDLGGLGPDGAGDAYLERRLPVLRADLSVCDRYQWTPRAPLQCPMTAFSAFDDPIATAAEVEAWREYTTGSLLHRHLPGNHFYLLSGPSRLRLLRDLRGDLGRLTADPATTADPRPTLRSAP
jgi:surfactin synthase thioesterase subunit